MSDKRYTLADWRQEVTEGDTQLGWSEWWKRQQEDNGKVVHTYTTIDRNDNEASTTRREHNGYFCIVTRAITQVDDTHDEECLPMFRVLFSDGTEDEAFSEELDPKPVEAINWNPKPLRYLVRINCEYTKLVDARTEDEAIALADTDWVGSADGWEASWSTPEVEVDDSHG